METGRIETPDVNLYYTRRGTGPVLLILQGGSGNADGSEALADELADRFSVVTYDRRGLSRSTPVRSKDFEIATHAADAARLISALSAEPVFVFGASIGAVIGVELAVAHSSLVRRLVAHEPPIYLLLHGAEQEEAIRSHLEWHETFQREGLAAAMKLMIARSGVDINDREPEVPSPMAAAADPQFAAQRATDTKHFLTWDVPAVTRYQPDLTALSAARTKIVPAVGTAPKSAPPYQCALALAETIGLRAVEFPGGHIAYILRPKAFAAKLAQLLM